MRDGIPPQHAVRIGAALFNGDHGHLADEVQRIEASGLDFVHLDVFDGHFVPDLGFSPRSIAALRPLTRLPFEVHLGAEQPLRFVPHLVDAGVDLIVIHAESAPLLHETLFSLRDQGVKVGVALALGTPIAVLAPVVEMVDAVLLLSRVTGEGSKGAEFNPRVLPRLRAVRDLATTENVQVDLQVAGGLTLDVVSDVVVSGASSLALGGALYRGSEMSTTVREIREAIARE